MKKKYIDLSYIPKENEVLCLYYLEPEKGYSLKDAAINVAGESSIDTWSDIKTLKEEIFNRLKPHIYYIDEKKKLIKIAYPLELFELGSVAQMFSSVAGNIFGMKLVKNLRLLDIRFPKEIINSFRGPLFGIEGVRKKLNIHNRPLLGTIVKPKLGLSSFEHANVAYNAWLGGLDLVKDDENLTNQNFNDFETRIKETFKLKRKVEEKTKEQKAYLSNISAGTVDEMIQRAKLVKKYNGNYVMIDYLTVGFTGTQSFREVNESLGLIIHGHRAMHAAITRNKKHGISMLILGKTARLLGLDQLHIGTVIGKMEGEKEEIFTIRDSIKDREIKEGELNFEQNWFNLKNVFPVASGGLHPLMIPKLYKLFGKDVILQFGGGVHAHPDGTLSGAKACKQALDASLKGIDLKVYAKDHEELKAAIKKWQ